MYLKLLAPRQEWMRMIMAAVLLKEKLTVKMLMTACGMSVAAVCNLPIAVVE